MTGVFTRRILMGGEPVFAWRCLVVHSTVPDFFQEESADALRDQVDWLVREVGVDDAFFAKLVVVDAVTFSRWRECSAPLPPSSEETLRDLWRAVLHLLSFLNFDPVRLRDLLQTTMPTYASDTASPLTPPWSGTSLKAYLEGARADGIEKVATWVTGLRFGDPYAA
jgi:hypothetical protein